MMRGKSNLLTPDALLPLTILPTFATYYTDPLNSTHPEVSPLYMDYAGLPTLFFITSKEEMRMNDTTMIAERYYKTGAHTTYHIWPTLPHALPVSKRFFLETRTSSKDMILFSKTHYKELDARSTSLATSKILASGNQDHINR